MVKKKHIKYTIHYLEIEEIDSVKNSPKNLKQQIPYHPKKKNPLASYSVSSWFFPKHVIKEKPYKDLREEGFQKFIIGTKNS